MRYNQRDYCLMSTFFYFTVKIRKNTCLLTIQSKVVVIPECLLTHPCSSHPLHRSGSRHVVDGAVVFVAKMKTSTQSINKCHTVHNPRGWFFFFFPFEEREDNYILYLPPATVSGCANTEVFPRSNLMLQYACKTCGRIGEQEKSCSGTQRNNRSQWKNALRRQGMSQSNSSQGTPVNWKPLQVTTSSIWWENVMSVPSCHQTYIYLLWTI